MSLSRSVGTPEHSAATSSSRIAASPLDRLEGAGEAARPAVLDHHGVGQHVGEGQAERHHREQVLRVIAEAERRVVLQDDIGAARTADVVPVHDEGVEHFGHGEGGDGEEHAAQPQREVAGTQAHQARDRGTDGNRERDRRLEKREHHDAGIGPQREERRGAEIHVTGEPTQYVPRRGEDDELQHDVRGRVEIVVRHRGERERDHEEGDREHDQREPACLHRFISRGAQWA